MRAAGSGRWRDSGFPDDVDGIHQRKPTSLAAAGDSMGDSNHRAHLLRRVHFPPQALPEIRNHTAPSAGLRQRDRLAGMGALVLRGTSANGRMSRDPSWWLQSGRLLEKHPELLTDASGIRGFGAGARWMHRAMPLVGWRMPPFQNSSGYERLGWLKYGVCCSFATVALAALWSCGWMWIAPLVAVIIFYAFEAQMVFLFPESLLGRRAPWSSAWALTSTAGGTVAVMRSVMPIAVGMLGTGWWRGRGREAWIQGCLAVVIWHRQVAIDRKDWVENASDLRLLEIGPSAPLLLRREKVEMPGAGSFRVLWISDLHWRGEQDAGTVLALLKLAQHEQPDVIILGGDFIERAEVLPYLTMLVRALARLAPCVALPGNHDQGSFADMIPNAIRSAGGCWLPESGRFEIINLQGGRLEILAAGMSRTDDARSICAVHDPAELDKYPPEKGSLILAGHLHGGQWVLAERAGKLLPAAWIYRHAWLRRRFLDAEWIVSRGAGDTFPIRWNCPREVLLCEIS